ncbi:MAG: hypothetical protein ABWZ99_11530 [Ilumatobacteraceae bacterium]
MRPFLIMFLVLVEVALWQWRVAVTGRGQYLRGAVLGGVGAVIQITVVLRLVGDVGGAASIMGYAAGVAFGVAAGGVLDRRATPQLLKVQVIAPSHHRLPREVRAHGWPVTQFTARGDEGELDVINIAVADRLLPELERIVDRVSPDAVWIVERVMRGRGLAVPPAVGRAGRAYPGDPGPDLVDAGRSGGRR